MFRKIVKTIANYLASSQEQRDQFRVQLFEFLGW